MSELVDFSPHQHTKFSQLVYRAIVCAAKKKGLLLDDYVQSIYYGNENPRIFFEPESLLSIYKQYKQLIESAVSTVSQVHKMNNCSKTYLCYRIYLHALTIEYNIMPEADAKMSLIYALREFFYARGRILTLPEELKIINFISDISDQAPRLKSKKGVG